jgi:hypothetical protein
MGCPGEFARQKLIEINEFAANCMNCRLFARRVTPNRPKLCAGINLDGGACEAATGRPFFDIRKNAMKKTKLIVAAAAAVLASSVAFADEPPNFEGADANGDGGVDATEFAATKLDKEFAKVDTDGDGKLNKEEYAAALEEDCE